MLATKNKRPNRQTTTPNRTNRLLLILLAAVVLRVAVALYLGNEVDAPALLTDQRSYDALGARLLDGHGFSFAANWYPFTPAAAPTAHWSFLQSLYVAAIYGLFGANPLAVRLVTALLGGLLLPLLSYRLTQRLFPARAATPLPLLAALLTALYAYFILYAATLMTETLFIASLLWSLERTLALGQRLRQPTTNWRATRWRELLPTALLPNALTLGLALGLTALFRQSILPAVPLLFLWLLFVAGYAGWQQGRGWLRIDALISLTIAGLLLILCLLPFTIRNYQVYGQFLLLNSNSGFAMYSAQHPLHGARFQTFTAAPLPPNLHELGENEAQWDRALRQMGLEFIREDPVRYLRLSLSRVASYFEFWPTDTTLLHNAGRLLSFTLYLPFMVAGFILAGRQAKRGRGWLDFLTTPTALALLFITCYALLHILTWAMARYRLPLDAVAISFAALALQRLTGNWKRLT
jgi:hypothetical protein